MVRLSTFTSLLHFHSNDAAKRAKHRKFIKVLQKNDRCLLVHKICISGYVKVLRHYLNKIAVKLTSKYTVTFTSLLLTWNKLVATIMTAHFTVNLPWSSYSVL